MVAQAYGYILYRTQVTGLVNGDLHIEGMHDYAKVYVNGNEQGTLDTRLGTELRSRFTRVSPRTTSTSWWKTEDASISPSAFAMNGKASSEL